MLKIKKSLTLNRKFQVSSKFKKMNIKTDKIAMYCTGGIRCEKTSAFLNQSFKNVIQLKD